ncbi:eCIS core domain-containing protein [Niabella drilacis]|uniref:eCIS core domain-containing protein n=1 Tax=Niabella drilacis (strain DSM 25811 / CCM 8410 / CCUG 62505 / LMG 26954 / E90) TaxID=1285928 RepID=A0A1G6PR78_NIADE|nr:DUF4157 domain-containing protein [Niabella drilacis]SDC82589.1 protein of unknown function [Niabella drilacis]
MNYFRIKENSFIARLAAGKLRAKNVAMVIGRTIYLYGVTSPAFLADEHWVRHELKHIEQYQRYGVLKFLFKYLVQSIKHGYYNNPLEKEARAAENDAAILARFVLKPKDQGQV